MPLSLGIANETLVSYVDRWPGQEGRIWEQKVPSVLLYDRQGNVSATLLDFDCAPH